MASEDQQKPHQIDASDDTVEKKSASTQKPEDESPPIQIRDDRFLRFRNGMR